MRKRYIWVWVAVDATAVDQKCWQQFIKVNMSVSEDVRFLVVNSEDEFKAKSDILQKAGWSIGRWGEGWMKRVIYFLKEEQR